MSEELTKEFKAVDYVIKGLEQLEAMLKDGVLFDWTRAGDICRVYKGASAYCFNHASGKRTCVWEYGRAAPREEGFKFGGNSVIELIIGEETWNCFVGKSEHPEWSEDSYWPKGIIPKEKALGL
jgi:hypothetical protein